ncbi:NADH dehydrogenase [Liquorilactobacillus aquaticus DSM 21051]|uniref:NADH dehydrogenase n=1 Tax=Liquorilactobacillus aquaticus DSM 21051 TaxID=1423725 RepID=A0A0R2CTI1_9LACO|nr:nitroreductase family protein [Liquorilactobacillus aquaticus]KRM94935.1 NADH dehydrogenase [Liquorilactobacillus aquaticus DSM 21051]
MDFLNSLDERKSIRHFVPDMEISDQRILEMLNHAANAPSNNNSQPWRVVVIKNTIMKNKLKELSFGQSHVAEASAVLLILGDKSQYDIEKLVNYSIKHRLIEKDQAEIKQNRIETYFAMHPEDSREPGLRLDMGLFSMNLMHVIRAFGYDSVPMRGVNFNAVLDYLKIPKNLSPIMLLPIGKALRFGHRHIREDSKSFTTIIQ